MTDQLAEFRVRLAETIAWCVPRASGVDAARTLRPPALPPAWVAGRWSAVAGRVQRPRRLCGHLASWAGVCPGGDESAGKRRSGRTRKGNPWLRTALVEAAQATARTKDTYLAARYRRLTARRGRKKAVVAVAHTILLTPSVG